MGANKPPRGAHGPANETTPRPPANERANETGSGARANEAKVVTFSAGANEGAGAPRSPRTSPREQGAPANETGPRTSPHGPRGHTALDADSAPREDLRGGGRANETPPRTRRGPAPTRPRSRHFRRARHTIARCPRTRRANKPANKRERDALPDPAPGSAPRCPPRPLEDPPRPPGAAGGDPPRPTAYI